MKITQLTIRFTFDEIDLIPLDFFDNFFRLSPESLEKIRGKIYKRFPTFAKKNIIIKYTDYDIFGGGYIEVVLESEEDLEI